MITTHILDLSTGFPARAVPVKLERLIASGWSVVGSGVTDEDGRLRDLFPPEMSFTPGSYRLIFDTLSYFNGQKTEGFFFPQVTVEFYVSDTGRHYHVPLLLSPFGYSTYRGS
jgi:5-hydroxyisourate hydrolase